MNGRAGGFACSSVSPRRLPCGYGARQIAPRETAPLLLPATPRRVRGSVSKLRGGVAAPLQPSPPADLPPLRPGFRFGSGRLSPQGKPCGLPPLLTKPHMEKPHLESPHLENP